MNKKVTLIKHPLIQHKLTHIRKKDTNSKEFKEFLDEITRLMAYEVLKDIKLEEIEIETPIAKTTGFRIAEKVNLYPILRAGQGMVDGFTTTIPFARIGHIGMYRDEKTLQPVEYLFKYPKDTEKDTYNIIIDPMLATGGSAIAAIEKLKSNGIENLKFVALLGSQEAIDNITKKHPDVEIFICAIDPKLDENGYIVPGLGDAGDRIFGTK
ncbi:MAG: uracil phosphoribosyltransferase [Candidatus Tyloplasma litorale]|nr:MAG: uracil phosphoribosyltransferase [Mycoplasmatales bacterium]